MSTIKRMASSDIHQEPVTHRVVRESGGESVRPEAPIVHAARTPGRTEVRCSASSFEVHEGGNWAWGYPAAIGIMLVLSVVLWYLFHRQHWL
jgi:hypothetical protein